jgi:hypothetical protein
MFNEKIRKFREKVKNLSISREVLPKDKNLTMKHKGFLKREKFNQNKIQCRKIKIKGG